MNKKIFVTIISLAMLSSVMAIVAPAEEIKNQADEQTFVYHFKEGWNIITLPLNMENSSIKWLFGDLIDNDKLLQFFYLWDPYQQHSLSFSGNYSLIPGYGYQCYAYETFDYSISGYEITEDLSISIGVPHNIIGWVHEHNITAEDICEAIPECEYVSILIDPLNDIRLTYYPGEIENNFNITQGMGFWVGANTTSIWDGKLASPDFELEVYGMLGATILIKNIGNAGASNIKYNVSVKGGILQGINFTTEEVIPLLNASNELNVDIFLFGLGMIEINATLYADDETKLCNVQATGIIIGPFIITLPDELE